MKWLSALFTPPKRSATSIVASAYTCKILEDPGLLLSATDPLPSTMLGIDTSPKLSPSDDSVSGAIEEFNRAGDS